VISGSVAIVVTFFTAACTAAALSAGGAEARGSIRGAEGISVAVLM
jgi:hypothetical protein